MTQEQRLKLFRQKMRLWQKRNKILRGPILDEDIPDIGEERLIIQNKVANQVKEKTREILEELEEEE